MEENLNRPATKRWIGKAMFVVIFLPILGLILWTWGALHFVYASGERSGFVQKISKKGWIFKTWEGELAMVNLPGTVPQIFPFTVRDDSVVADIEKTLGQRVSLHYEQHCGIPGTIFGDTQYFVTRVIPTGNAADAMPK